jgi:hypothetical protein
MKSDIQLNLMLSQTQHGNILGKIYWLMSRRRPANKYVMGITMEEQIALVERTVFAAIEDAAAIII